jgi:hypothetical protein
MPHMASVSLLWVGVGSRYEPEDLCESHLSNTFCLDAQATVSQDVEGIGGYLNTSEETIVFSRHGTTGFRVSRS